MNKQKTINIKQFGLPANVIIENYDYIGRMTNTKLRYIYCGRYILDCQKKVVYDMGGEDTSGIEVVEREK